MQRFLLVSMFLLQLLGLLLTLLLNLLFFGRIRLGLCGLCAILLLLLLDSLPILFLLRTELILLLLVLPVYLGVRGGLHIGPCWSRRLARTD